MESLSGAIQQGTPDGARCRVVRSGKAGVLPRSDCQIRAAKERDPGQGSRYGKAGRGSEPAIRAQGASATHVRSGACVNQRGDFASGYYVAHEQSQVVRACGPGGRRGDRRVDCRISEYLNRYAWLAALPGAWLVPWARHGAMV